MPWRTHTHPPSWLDATTSGPSGTHGTHPRKAAGECCCCVALLSQARPAHCCQARFFGAWRRAKTPTHPGELFWPRGIASHPLLLVRLCFKYHTVAVRQLGTLSFHTDVANAMQSAIRQLIDQEQRA